MDDPELSYVESKSRKRERVYVDGVYDLFHVGHVNFFKRVREMFDNVWLIAGITSDCDTEKFKGKTVISAKERCEMVRQCRYVDEVIEDCPWKIDSEFIKSNNIDWVVHDETPYEMGGDGDDVYSYVKSIGKFKHADRTYGISSTDIISKIIKNYNHYLVRNLKRGMNRKDLNLSWWTVFHVMATHKIKTGELLKDATELAKDIEEHIDLISDKFIKKNELFQNRIDEIRRVATTSNFVKISESVSCFLPYAALTIAGGFFIFKKIYN